MPDGDHLTTAWSKNCNLLHGFACISFGGLLFGYIIGINSNVLVSLQCQDEGQDNTGWKPLYNQCFHLTAAQDGLLSSLNLIGACSSSLFCFVYADSLGRKLEMQLAATLYLMGAVISTAIPALAAIFLGFFLYGLGVGFAMHAAPVYIAEISPADLRGTLVSAKEAMIVLGIFLGFLSGFIFAPMSNWGWRLMVCSSGVAALVMLLGLRSIPDSPRFLVLTAFSNRHSQEELLQKAHASMNYFRGSKEEASKELETLVADVRSMFQDDSELQPLVGGKTRSSLLEAFGYPRPLLVACGLVVLQQVSGQPSVLYFATNIFVAAGFQASSAAQSLWVGLVKLLATCLTVWQVDRFGRRCLLFSGIGLMAAALVVLCWCFFQSSCKTPDVSHCGHDQIELRDDLRLLSVAALMLYVSGYQIGFGPIVWLLISEVFPLRVRGSALSVAALVNFGSNALVAALTPVLMEWLTPAGLFSVFLLMALVSLAFVYAVVPETRGKSLEQIETMMVS